MAWSTLTLVLIPTRQPFSCLLYTSFSYQLAPTQSLRASYNVRISRPGIWFLNPFTDTSNPTAISYGNPDVESEKAHSLSVTFGSFSQKFNVNVSANYSFVNNGIEQYSFICLLYTSRCV